MQATFLGENKPKGTIRLQLSNKSSFFSDKIKESVTIWQPYLEKSFPGAKSFEYEQVSSTPPPTPPSQQQTKQPQQNPFKPYNTSNPYKRSSGGPFEQIIDIKDKEKWPLANLILSHFPGKIVRKRKVYS